MKNKLLFLYLLASAFVVNAQNVGINNPNPQFPLSFNGSLGDKISLWTDGTPTHYGFGIQSSLLQVFSKTDLDNIGFGYGSSSSFTQRMLIKNSGEFGMELNGRILLRNGTTPLNLNYGAGIWLAKPDNSNTMGFVGVQDAQNMGFYGGPSGWGLTYNTGNSYVGIGNNTPNAPLSFAASFGKKITFFQGPTGDIGIGVQPGLMQIYSDNPNTDIALGYDQAGTFTERFRVKANGALVVNGNAGAPGQVLQSNGAGGAPVWVTPIKIFTPSSSVFSPMTNNGDESALSQVTVTVTQPSYIEITGTIGLYSGGCFGCGDATVYLLLHDPSQTNDMLVAANSHVISVTTMGFVYRTLFTFSPGTYTFSLKAKKISGPTVESPFIYLSGYNAPDEFIRAKVIPD
ncbi:MAG: hypothetical protein ABI741_04160 [Ferruginibacter sp.]